MNSGLLGPRANLAPLGHTASRVGATGEGVTFCSVQQAAGTAHSSSPEPLLPQECLRPRPNMNPGDHLSRLRRWSLSGAAHRGPRAHTSPLTCSVSSGRLSRAVAFGNTGPADSQSTCTHLQCSPGQCSASRAPAQSQATWNVTYTRVFTD